MSEIEIVAALVGLVCVALAAVRSIWTYPTGIASVAMFGSVFFTSRLYSDALLQAFFVAANIYGWANWRHERSTSGDVVVAGMTGRERAAWAIGCAIVALGWGAMMQRHTDASYPWADAALASISVAAQLLMAQRRWENWMLWIVVDAASLPLYVAKGLWVTAALYAGYLGLAVWGLIAWRRGLRAEGISA